MVRKVIVKTILYYWTNRDLRFWKQFFHGVCQQMGGRVTHNLQSLRTLIRNNGELTIFVDHKTRIHYLAVNNATQGRFSKSTTNTLGNVRYTNGSLKFAF